STVTGGGQHQTAPGCPTDFQADSHRLFQVDQSSGQVEDVRLLASRSGPRSGGGGRLSVVLMAVMLSSSTMPLLRMLHDRYTQASILGIPS
ncbi:hypothetical protein GOODEAATRI_019918, partial [Goodea atripinnis]